MVGLVRGLGCGCCGEPTYCTTDDWADIGPEGAYGSFEYDRVEEFNNGTSIVAVPPWRESSANTSRMRQAFGYGHNSNNSSDIYAPFTITYDNTYEVFTRQRMICVAAKQSLSNIRSYYISPISGFEMVAPIFRSTLGLFSGVTTNLGTQSETTCTVNCNLPILTLFYSAGNVNYSFPAVIGNSYLGFDIVVEHYIRAITTSAGVL